MSGRGGGGGRRGGVGGGRRGDRRAGYEGFTREPQPPPTGGGGRDQEGRQRDRGGSAPPPPAPFTQAESSLSRDAERLSLSETKPVVVTPESSSAIVPAPVDATPRSDKSIRLPARPGFGTAGNKCLVKANHFSVEINDIDIDLCCYNVRSCFNFYYRS